MEPWFSDWRLLGWTVIGLFTIFFFPHASGNTTEPLDIIGTQGLSVQRLSYPPTSLRMPRVNVLEVDVWKRSLEDGSLTPVANVPFAPHELIHYAHFTPTFYQHQIERLDGTYARQKDVLMYFGAFLGHAPAHGLNFNGWTVEDLRHLRAGGSCPFIGLETTDAKAVEWMARRLHEAGYTALNRIYIRICSEPSIMSYGSENGMVTGKHHTRAAYAAYRRRFARVSRQLHQLNSRFGLDMYSVFAGTTAEDFKSYFPADQCFDALGYDLYVTPANKEKVLQLIATLRHQFPWKPLVIPEFGIATAGPGASPRWAQNTLADVLMQLEKHPAGVSGVTVFSVNVAERLPPKRWSWAWTPVMFDMLKEWQASPRHWRKEGFHRYDPLSYPIGRDVLYLDRPDLRVVYRRLASSADSDEPYFHEVCLYLQQHHKTTTRIFAFK